MDLLGLALILLVAAVIYYYLSKPSKLPPGPVGIPFLGSAPFIKTDEPFITLTEWKKKYGPLMSFYMGNQLIVVLADTETIREALSKQGDVFSGRPISNAIPSFLDIHSKRNTGVINSSGPLWKEQRRFAVSTLRDFGFGRPLVENKIREEVDFVLSEMACTKGQPFDPQKLLNNSISNVICSVVFGRRFDCSDSRFLELMELLNFILSKSGQNILSLHHYFPLILFFTAFLKIRSSFRKLFSFNDDQIEEHKKTFHPSDEPNDYIHAYMKAQLEGTGISMDDANLNTSIMSLFAAGTETTATTLRWSLMFMGLMQDIQKKVYDEITTQVREGNIPSWADKSKLPYTDAVIMEIQRISNLTPMAVPHRTTADTTLMGYHIPKDATVIPLPCDIHRDSEIFADEHKFNPDRFLEDDGKTHVKYDAFMPSSAGKRICLGESLAKMELFLFFTAIMARYRIHFDGIEKPDPYQYYAGVTITPKPFKIIADPR